MNVFDICIYIQLPSSHFLLLVIRTLEVCRDFSGINECSVDACKFMENSLLHNFYKAPNESVLSRAIPLVVYAQCVIVCYHVLVDPKICICWVKTAPCFEIVAKKIIFNVQKLYTLSWIAILNFAVQSSQTCMRKLSEIWLSLSSMALMAQSLLMARLELAKHLQCKVQL